MRRHGEDIFRSERFRSMKQYLQHGEVTVYKHSVNVAKASINLADRLHIKLQERELIRGALLHDYFLYDWHIPEGQDPGPLHGFHHPKVALRNALAEYELTEREKEIIRRHMWPMTLIPPRCREAWVVLAADKWVSLLETLHIYKGHGKTDQNGNDGN